MVDWVHSKMRGFTYALGVAIVLGSIVPDIDHVFEAIGKFPRGRFAHTDFFAFAIFLIGCILAYIGGLYVWLVLGGDK